jgi:hypothetical protein
MRSHIALLVALIVGLVPLAARAAAGPEGTTPMVERDAQGTSNWDSVAAPAPKGEPKWMVTGIPGVGVMRAPLVDADGNLYFQSNPTGPDNLRSYDADGNLRWVADGGNMGSWGAGMVLGNGGRLYFPNSEYITCLNTSDGSVIWTLGDTGSESFADLGGFANQLLTMDSAGTIYARTAGKVEGAGPLTFVEAKAMAIDDLGATGSVVWVSSTTLGTWQGTASAEPVRSGLWLNPSEDKAYTHWIVHSPNYYVANPVGLGNSVIAAGVACLDPSDGTVLWTIQLDGTYSWDVTGTYDTIAWLANGPLAVDDTGCYIGVAKWDRPTGGRHKGGYIKVSPAARTSKAMADTRRR